MSLIPDEKMMVHELKLIREEAQKTNELLDMIYTYLVERDRENPLD